MLFDILCKFSILALGVCMAEEFPVVICKRNIDDYPTCLKLAIEESWPRFVQGLTEYELPPLDPLVFLHEDNEFNSGELRGRVITSNVTCRGVAKTRILDVKPHFFDNGLNLIIDTYLSKIICDGKLEVNANFMGINMNTSGHFYANLTGLKTPYDITGHVENDTLIIDHFYVLPVIKTMKTCFTDLFEGNEDFNNLITSLVNDLWPPIYRMVMETTIKIRDQWFTNIANKFFSKIPFSKLFPLN